MKSLQEAKAMAKAKGWTIVEMKKDWNVIFQAGQKQC
jgi:hypothetical protein